MINRKLLFIWIRATFLGWLLGIFLIIAFALLGEAVGIVGLQFPVGAGIGTGIGFMQARVIRDLIHRSSFWFLSCAAGLSFPFLVTDISRAAGWSVPYSLTIAVICGGVIVSGWQAFLLRSYRQQAWLWAASSLLGWAAAAETAALADSLQRSSSFRGLFGAALYLGIVASGGIVLGLITGICLARTFRTEHAGRVNYIKAASG